MLKFIPGILFLQVITIALVLIAPSNTKYLRLSNELFNRTFHKLWQEVFCCIMPILTEDCWQHCPSRTPLTWPTASSQTSYRFGSRPSIKFTHHKNQLVDLFLHKEFLLKVCISPEFLATGVILYLLPLDLGVFQPNILL